MVLSVALTFWHLKWCAKFQKIFTMPNLRTFDFNGNLGHLVITQYMARESCCSIHKYLETCHQYFRILLSSSHRPPANLCSNRFSIPGGNSSCSWFSVCTLGPIGWGLHAGEEGWLSEATSVYQFKMIWVPSAKYSCTGRTQRSSLCTDSIRKVQEPVEWCHNIHNDKPHTSLTFTLYETWFSWDENTPKFINIAYSAKNTTL